MRDRLIELLNKVQECGMDRPKDDERYPTLYPSNEQVADHLLANGVIVPPCKVGDALYWVDEYERKIEKFVAYAMQIIGLDDNYFSFTVQFSKENGHRKFNYQFFGPQFGKTVFLTREEAEAALAEREGKV